MGSGYGSVATSTTSPPSMTMETDMTDYAARAERWSAVLFKYLLLVQVAMYLEAGAVPSLLQQFTLTFNLDPQEQGLLGAVVFLSLALTSPWCSTLFRRFSPRSLLGGSLVANNLAVLAFGCAPTHARYSKPLLIGLRGVIGVSQAFHCVYCPLWVHDYAPKAKRGKWMSYLQGAVPIGITLGYFAGSVTLWLASARVPATEDDVAFPDDYEDAMERQSRHPLLMTFASSAWAWATGNTTTNAVDAASSATATGSMSLCRGIYCWRWPFLFQFALVLPLSVLLFLVPTRHIRLKSTRRQSIVIVDATEDDGREARDYSDTDAADSSSPGVAPLLPTADEPRAPHSAASTAASSSAPLTPPTPPERQRRPATSLDLDAVRDSLEETVSRWSNLGLLLQHKVYVFIVMGLSALFFVVAGVQFWTTLYLETNTDDSLYEIHTAYLLVSGTGPILGVFFGGWLIDKCGGYAGAAHQARALRVCMLLGGAGCLASLPVSYVHNTLAIAVFLWLMLFCGGAILPACSGIVISSAPARLRPLASSVAYACYNLFGYAASNYLPGLIMNYIIDKDGSSGSKCDAACTYRIGFRIVLLWSVWAFFCLTCGAVASARSLAAIKARQRAGKASSLLLLDRRV